MCRDGEKVSEGWGQERGELLFGEEFEERRFVVVEGRLECCHELHDGRWIENGLS